MIIPNCPQKTSIEIDKRTKRLSFVKTHCTIPISQLVTTIIITFHNYAKKENWMTTYRYLFFSDMCDVSFLIKSCDLTNGVVLNNYMEIYLEFFSKSLPCPPLITLHLASLSIFNSHTHLVLSHIQVILIIFNNRQILVVRLHAFNIFLTFSMSLFIACFDQSMWSFFSFQYWILQLFYTNVVFHNWSLHTCLHQEEDNGGTLWIVHCWFIPIILIYSRLCPLN
jgi:hypothetical protein